jgi:DNA-directed RNA polymerase specialized sigma24 family protein
MGEKAKSSAEGATQWIGQIKAGDQAPAQKLWEQYFRRLVGLARKKLAGFPRRMANEEDVALSALDSFFAGAERGRFPQLRDRDDLWHLLVVITVRKVADLKQHERRQRRGGGDVRGESAWHETHRSARNVRGIEQVVGHEPTPAIAAQMIEECRRLLENLGDDRLRSLALMKMEGFTNSEIAANLGCSRGTIERKLRLIRGLWSRERSG